MLVLVVCAIVLAPAFATTYHVSPDGDDAAPGTRNAPWRTLAKANETLRAGDTVVLLPGEHAGVIEPANSGEDGSPVAYRGEAGAVLTGGESSDGVWTCVRLKEREHIVVEGFTLLPVRGGWMALDSASYCVIRKCHMEAARGTYNPIICNDCHYNRYEDLKCWRSLNTGEYGHLMGDMWNNNACTHNVFERVHISRAGHRPFGIWFDSDHNVIRSCTFDCRWGRNFEFFSAPRLLVEGCVITNGFDGSGSADGRAKLFIIDSIFRRNAIYRNYYGPIVINSYQWQELEPFGMMRSRVYHNTFTRNHEYGYEMVDKGAEPDPHYVDGNVFQNNIFAGNDPGGDGLALKINANIGKGNVFKHNVMYGAAPGAITVREVSGEDMTTAQANEQRPEQFIDNIDADPLFADPDSDDYRLQPGSPCIDAGQSLATVREDGSGNEIPVSDARPFYDGFGIPGEVGDTVLVGRSKQRVVVVEADIDANVLTVNREISWKAGDGVTLPYAGSAPDLGAWEQRLTHLAPVIEDGLRLETMETATKPVVATDFEPENLEDWFYYWNFSRQRNTTARLDNTTAASGKHSMRVYATGDEANLSCDVRPRWWDIDRFPIVKFAYRIPEGTPVGVWLYPFGSYGRGRGIVCAGGTATREVSGNHDLGAVDLIDDGQWHEVTLDARGIRDIFPEVKLLQMLRFHTNRNATEGQEFWFDNFRIVPEAWEA